MRSKKAVIGLAKKIDVLSSSVSFNGRRSDVMQKEINALETRISYLECDKHDYKFDRVVDQNKQYGMYGSMLTAFFVPDLRYVFTCTKCNKELQKTEKELTTHHRAALRVLGVLPKSDLGDRKVKK